MYPEKMSVVSTQPAIKAPRAPVARPNVYMAVLLALSLSHLLNDTIQSLIPAVYPILKQSFALDFAKIGMITLTFQVAGALFQPAIGLYTDHHPLPYSAALGMIFTLVGVVSSRFLHGATPSSWSRLRWSGSARPSFTLKPPDRPDTPPAADKGSPRASFRSEGRRAPRSVRFWPRSSLCLAGKGASPGSPP